MAYRPESETIIGPVDQSIRDFLRTAPMGSSLTVTGPDSVERVIGGEPSVLEEFAEAASAIKDQVSHTLFQAGTIFRERVGSSPKNQNLREAPRTS